MGSHSFTAQEKWEILLEALGSTQGPGDVCMRRGVGLVELRRWLGLAREGALQHLKDVPVAAGAPLIGLQEDTGWIQPKLSGTLDMQAGDPANDSGAIAAISVHPPEPRPERVRNTERPRSSTHLRLRKPYAKPDVALRSPLMAVSEYGTGAHILYADPPLPPPASIPHPETPPLPASALSIEQIDELFSAVSHEFNEPLRGIKAIKRFIEEDFGALLPPEGHNYLETLEKTGQRMQTLVDGISEYARCTKRIRELRPCALADLLRKVRAELRPYTAEHNGTVVIDERLPVVQGDPIALAKAFKHLLHNGMKFNTDAAPRVVVVAIEAETNGAPAIVEVRDNGIGIEKKHHARIFEIFQRLHSHEQYPGAGIGLAVVRRVVLFHGGFVEVDSDGVKGTTFRIALRRAVQP